MMSGGRLLVAPNIDAGVIVPCIAAHAMVTMPGVFSPTEALAAVAAVCVGTEVLSRQAHSARLESRQLARSFLRMPSLARLAEFRNWTSPKYAANGIRVFGLGSSIYRPGMAVDDIAQRARRAVAAWDAEFAGTIEA